MAITDYEVQPLFAVPYFRANIGHAISDEQVAFIKNVKMVENRTNLYSENLYLLEEPELTSVRDAIDEVLEIYASQVMGIDQKLYVTQSWSLVNSPGVGMHTHSHSNSLVSGSFYYCELPQPVARMVFDRNLMYQQLALNPLQHKQNIYNTPVNVLAPRTHDVILFPSGLQHAVEPNTSNDPRYSIAFNCFVKGTIGSYRDVSELRL